MVKLDTLSANFVLMWLSTSQSSTKCSSFSTAPEVQSLHFLSSTGVGRGLRWRPFSISSWWLLILSFVRFTRSRKLSATGYISHYKSIIANLISTKFWFSNLRFSPGWLNYKKPLPCVRLLHKNIYRNSDGLATSGDGLDHPSAQLDMDNKSLTKLYHALLLPFTLGVGVASEYTWWRNVDYFSALKRCQYRRKYFDTCIRSGYKPSSPLTAWLLAFLMTPKTCFKKFKDQILTSYLSHRESTLELFKLSNSTVPTLQHHMK